MRYIIRFLFGGYRLKIVCDNPAGTSGIVMNRFAGVVYDVKVYDGYFTFSCFSYAKNRIINELKKHGLEVIETSVFGLVKKIRLLKSRPGLAIGVIFSVILVYLQTIPVWEIRVSGNKTIPDREIIDSLASVGFSAGKPKKNQLLSDFANQLIMTDHRLSRASINLSGNIAFVEVGERTEGSKSAIPSSMTGLYATRDAIIELPLAQKGTSVVRKGDTVYKGQLLISPVILGDNNVEYIVGSEGKVFAKTEDTFYTVVRYEKTIVKRTGNKISNKNYSFLGRSCSLNLPVADYENRFCKRNFKRLKVLNRFELPVDIVNIMNIEYESDYVALSEDEAKKEAYNILHARISDEKENAEILSFEYREAATDEYFLLECKVESIENIASPSF